MENVKIQLCGGIKPTKAHETDACFDLYVPKRTVLNIGRQVIPIGFKIQLPPNLCAYVRSRSGFSSKGMTAYLSCDANYEHPIRIDADVKTGVIDSGYTGIVGVIMICRGKVIGMSEEEDTEYFESMTKEWNGEIVIKEFERIAQMAIVPVPKIRLEEVDSIDKSNNRGDKGFGSTNDEKGGEK